MCLMVHRLLGRLQGRLIMVVSVFSLERPDTPPTEEPSYTPYITADEVKYNNVTPWAESAAGNGDSLSREYSNSFGDTSSAWLGASPTPGVKNTTILMPTPW